MFAGGAHFWFCCCGFELKMVKMYVCIESRVILKPLCAFNNFRFMYMHVHTKIHKINKWPSRKSMRITIFGDFIPSALLSTKVIRAGNHQLFIRIIKKNYFQVDVAHVKGHSINKSIYKLYIKLSLYH